MSEWVGFNVPINSLYTSTDYDTDSGILDKPRVSYITADNPHFLTHSIVRRTKNERTNERTDRETNALADRTTSLADSERDYCRCNGKTIWKANI